MQIRDFGAARLDANPCKYYTYDQKFYHLVLAYLLITCYNESMKDISYTIYNPFSGLPIMERIPQDRVQAMMRYFAKLTGTPAQYLVIKRFAKKPLTGASA